MIEQIFCIQTKGAAERDKFDTGRFFAAASFRHGTVRLFLTRSKKAALPQGRIRDGLSHEWATAGLQRVEAWNVHYCSCWLGRDLHEPSLVLGVQS